MTEVCPKKSEKGKEPVSHVDPETMATATVSMTFDPSDGLATAEEDVNPSPATEQEKQPVTIIAPTIPTATAPAAPAMLINTGHQNCCPGPPFHDICFSHGPYVGVKPEVTGCQKAPGFPGQCVCNAFRLSDPVQPAPHSTEKYKVRDSMAVSAGSASAKLMYQVPYLVEEDRQFWVHEPHGKYVMRSVKDIAEMECAGHWANTCTGQPYYQCEPKKKIRYDPKEFTEVFAKSGLSHLDFHKRYQPV